MSEAGTLRISVIVPSWRDADSLAVLLPALKNAEADEIIVVDASAEARAEEISRAVGATYVKSSAPSRGAQMNAGAAFAKGEILIFQHADTILGAAHLASLREAMRNPSVVGGAFYRKFDERHPWLIWLEPVARFLTRRGGSLYGDQSIFARRDVFLRLQGFAKIALMEDVEFSRRLRAAGAVAVLDPPVRSSPRHHLEKGPWRTTFRNGLFILFYKLGVAPERLHRWYYGEALSLQEERGFAKQLD